MIMVQVYKTYWWDSGLKGKLSSGQGGQWSELRGFYDHSIATGKKRTNLIHRQEQDQPDTTTNIQSIIMSYNISIWAD